MGYFVFGLLFLLWLLLSKGRGFLTRDARRRRKLQLLEYAGAAAIFSIMLESVIRGRAEVLWYPYAVMGVIAFYYSRKIYEWLKELRKPPAQYD
ncbi:hypothetical protein CYPRO_0525 [Cyclonatronum proteinivorum]|uniref:Uncharacterized protein n=1 Tax=Cyclonatronum proteinivorum TaxID=1457365 RepID=A0A345UH58_9BACT|nr:hypothetical protein [Cyclonatronum proteinivorum]AXI99809.1 hypothetical protein CYPRO_0525 [Cyclonatronum proteinivorum]